MSTLPRALADRSPRDLPEAIAELRRGHAIPDDVFDRIFPDSHRRRSSFHWTPVEIAIRACALLAPTPDRRVLDLGSGVGKLCLIGALTTPSSWFGIERDVAMVRVATAASQRLEVADRTRFLLGELASVDWPAFDAFYLFNPFAEALHGADDDALARRDSYVENVELVQRHLASTRPGTRVVTYHGLGGDLPRGFELAHREPARGDELCLWIRS
jgi:SAM-dependent methyltransferase